MEPSPFDAIRSEAAPLLEATPGEHRVVVWGAGELGRWLMEALGERGVAFVDANPAKHGREIVRRPVHPVDELGTLACDEVWVAVLSDVQAIRDRLRARRLAEGRDFHVPFAHGEEKQVQDALPRVLTSSAASTSLGARCWRSASAVSSSWPPPSFTGALRVSW